MPVEAGEPVLHGDISDTHDATSAVSAGDAVGIDGSGNLAPADANASVDLAGVAEEAALSLGLTGAYVANVATDLTAGRVGAPDDSVAGENAGELVANSTGPAVALCDEGGTWRGYDIPDGYAVVWF